MTLEENMLTVVEDMDYGHTFVTFDFALNRSYPWVAIRPSYIFLRWSLCHLL